MSALLPSKYSQAIIYSLDGETVDFRLSIARIQFFEDLFCPTISCRVTVVTAGGSTPGKGGDNVSMYEGLKLRGGEKVQLRIEANTSNNSPIDRMSDPMFVRSITNVMREESKDFYEINLVSKEAYQNEVSFLNRKYAKDSTISDHVKGIISEFFPATRNSNIEETSNPYGFMGNQMKPFEAITRLASESVPSRSSSAGYFFYQTLKGFNFRSVDGLIREGKQNITPRRKYVYSEAAYNSITFQPTPDLPSLDQKIASYDINMNQDLISKLRKGTYSSDRKYFDPVTFRVTGPEKKFGSESYTSETLGNPFDPSEFDKTDLGIDFSQKPSKILTGTFDRGTLDEKVTKDFTKNINEYQAQKRMRYNSLFTQIMTMTVPLNTTVNAGDVIECKVPQISDSRRPGFERGEVSGFYLIKELSHYYDSTGSYTSMKLLRDTYGIDGAGNTR
jgi:hypothetical protein